MKLTTLEVKEILSFVQHKGNCFRFGRNYNCWNCIINKISSRGSICKDEKNIYPGFEMKLPYVIKFMEEHPEYFFDYLL